MRSVEELKLQAKSSGAAKPLVAVAIIGLVVDLILIITNVFVDLPRLTLLAPLCITATVIFLMIIAFLQMTSESQNLMPTVSG
jgi:hypothetical protein